MDYFLISIVLFIASLLPTVITLFITEKVKGSIKNSFDQKIELLKKEHTLEVSKFQTELNALKARENFKFTKLHEKRMEVLENTYKLLNQALENLHQLVSPFKQIDKGSSFEENEITLFEKFINSYNQFREYYEDTKIYLDEEIEKLIDSYISEVTHVYSDYNGKHIMKQHGGFDLEINRKANTAYKRIPDKIAPIKKEIEKKFKELLELSQ